MRWTLRQGTETAQLYTWPCLKYVSAPTNSRCFAPSLRPDLLEADTGPSRVPDGALAPGSVDQLVPVAGVLVDLLDTARPGTLDGDDVALPGEDRFILELLQGEGPGVVDQAADLESELIGVNMGDTPVVADKEVLV